GKAMASVFKRSGRPGWYAQIRGRDGVWRPKKMKGLRKAEAQREAEAMNSREWKISVGIEIAPSESGLTFGDIIADWLVDIDRRGLEQAPSAFSAVNQHIEPSALWTKPAHLATSALIEDLLQQLDE